MLSPAGQSGCWVRSCWISIGPVQRGLSDRPDPGPGVHRQPCSDGSVHVLQHRPTQATGPNPVWRWFLCVRGTSNVNNPDVFVLFHFAFFVYFCELELEPSNLLFCLFVFLSLLNKHCNNIQFSLKAAKPERGLFEDINAVCSPTHTPQTS